MELFGRDAAAEEPSSAKSPVAEPSAPKAPASAAAAAPPAAAGSASAVPASPAPPAASSAAAARLLDVGDEPVEARSPLMGFSSTPVLSLEEAGRKCAAFVTELSVMLSACQALVVERKSSGEIVGGISDAAAATLALYSAGWDVPSKSFYAIVNAALRAKDRCGVVPHYGILRLMCVGFESLNPRIGTLYRGVRGALAHLYPIGKSIVWWAFSSCTTSIDVLQDELFLGKVGARTLFIIENAVGFDITAFSFFQNESEVLMPAGAEVLVKSHLDAGNGLTMVTLQMVRTTNCIVDLNKHLPAAANTPNMHGELVKGLNDVFEKAKLSDEKRALVTHWCREQEAAELEEIKELFDELCAAVEMPALPKKRFSKALDEALSGT